MAVLALSTSFAPAGETLAQTVAKAAALGAGRVVLHRAPRADEWGPVGAAARRIRIVAVYGDEPEPRAGDALRVVEGGPAGADREASLLALCRHLHAWRRFRVALRTPPDADSHPAPHELILVAGEVPHVGYWHDVARGGAAYLDLAGALVRGASFDPLAAVDLAGLRQALPAAAPAAVACAAGAARDEVEEALRCARGVFRD